MRPFLGKSNFYVVSPFPHPTPFYQLIYQPKKDSLRLELGLYTGLRGVYNNINERMSDALMKEEKFKTNMGFDTESEIKIQLWHGGSSIVRVPDLSIGRDDVDFGRGFYLTEKYDMSAKWACRKATSICNEYTLSLEGLSVYKFKLDYEWLQFVVANRNLGEIPVEYSQYDVLIGAIADDKLFATIDLYEDGLISFENAVKVLNCMDYGEQYVLKSENALKNLEHVGHIKILGAEKDNYKRMYREDRVAASSRTHALIREINQESRER